VAAKRALIVDDSKSARVVLSRLLEKHELAVDTTDSAEDALLYLREHRPDVIFMDQVMSGMDGLSAVQAIKSDPSTAAIPIMMYTSQDGELYAGEARALGAVGVLPKRLAPADIASALYQLQLLPDRRTAPPDAFDRVQLPAVEAGAGPLDAVIVRAATAEAARAAAPPAAAELRAVVEPLLQEQGAELRRFVLASLESMSARVVTEVAARVGAAVAAALPAPPTLLPSAPEPAVAPPRPARPRGWIALALLGCLLAAASGLVSWRQHRELGALGARLDAAAQEVAAANRAIAEARSAAAAEARPAARLAVPYGEAALAGARLTELAVLLAGLEARGFEGTVAVTSAVADFCLTGNPTEGYGLAPGEMPANRCDVVGNPFEESLKPGEREPAALGALIGGVRERTRGAIDVRFEHRGRTPVAGTDPPTPDASAAQWNAAAARRNYVEFAVAPQPASP
jgi:CheY-like chemotaxis protein